MAAVVAFLVAMMCYATLSIILGQAGILAQDTMRGRIAVMKESLMHLEAENARLAEELSSLSRDPERMAREARRLGYLRRDERLIMIHSPWMGKAWMHSGEEDPSSKVVRAGSSVGLSDMLIKEIALGIAAIVFVGGLVLMAPRKRDSTTADGIAESAGALGT